MLENIVKPELPQSTLEIIRQEKNSGTPSNGKRYEFNLIVNITGFQEKIALIAINYEELKQWIVGVNALIANKNNLTRLSTLIT